MQQQIKIGTRGSPLALKQSNEVKEKLTATLVQLNLSHITIDIVPITTSGDKQTNVKLSQIGGKGLFTKEIEEALRERTIDLAVHSMKDVETWYHPDFVIPCMLEREDARDSWICLNQYTLKTIPPKSRVGTSSLRRTAQILHMRPDLEVVTFRGNVETRLNKLAMGEADATFLALAGLKRLNRTEVATEILSPEIMIPAVGQGALGIQCLTSRTDLIDLLFVMNHLPTFYCVTLERAFLEEIDGSCGTPVGGFATFIDSSLIQFMCCVATPDGKSLDRQHLTCSINEAEGKIRALGKQMHQWLKAHQVK